MLRAIVPQSREASLRSFSIFSLYSEFKMEESFAQLTRAHEEVERASLVAATWGSGYLVDLVASETLPGCGPEAAEHLQGIWPELVRAAEYIQNGDAEVRVSLCLCPAAASQPKDPSLLADAELVAQASGRARWMIEAVKLAYRAGRSRLNLPNLVVRKYDGDIAFEDGTMCLRPTIEKK